MRLVIDANILFAALIKEGSTAKLLLSDKLQRFKIFYQIFNGYTFLIMGWLSTAGHESLEKKSKSFE